MNLVFDHGICTIDHLISRLYLGAMYRNMKTVSRGVVYKSVGREVTITKEAGVSKVLS